jgi:hypothetical protein
MSEDPDAALRETQVDSKPVYQGNFLDVRRDQVRLPDGATATREYIVHPGAVMIVPILDDGPRDARVPGRQAGAGREPLALRDP